MVEKKSHLISSFSILPTEENQNLLKELKILGAREGSNFSEMVQKAIVEYVQRHSPGNPQLILGHWTSGTQFPQTIREKNHNWKQMRSVYSEAGAAWICTDHDCREGWFQP